MGKLSYEVAQSYQQDKLNQGLLKTMNGDYLYIRNYGKPRGTRSDGESAVRWDERFDDTQDRLKDGLVKLVCGDYLLISKLGRVQEVRTIKRVISKFIG